MDAPPIRQRKLSTPDQFGYVDQLCDITANTKHEARVFILTRLNQSGNPAEDTLRPSTAAELARLENKWRTDGGGRVQCDGE